MIPKRHGDQAAEAAYNQRQLAASQAVNEPNRLAAIYQENLILKE